MSRRTFGLGLSFRALAIAAICAPPATAGAFEVPVHLRITREEIRPLRASVNGQSKGFSDKALEQISDENEAVDNPFTYSAALWQSNRHFTNEQYGGSSQRLINLRQEIIELITRPTPNGSEAREKLGQALHAIQDFYSHSNWVERGNADINYALGTSVLPDPSPASANCPSNPNVLGPNGGGTLTSAYYLGALGCSVTLPENKCYHGNYMLQCIGINKDLDAAGAAEKGVPQNPFHPAAASLARKNTKQFVEGILSALAGNDLALSALLDVKGTLGFVVDDTGSMGPSIAGVVSTINQIIDRTVSNPEIKPDNYLLLIFGDPLVGTPFITQDAFAIRNAVAAIDPYGGVDCPELSQTALASAVDAASAKSLIYLFTDAAAKDSYMTNQVIARAAAKGTKIIYALTGSCSPIDPAYIRGAAETGGQLFRLQPQEIPQLFSLILPQLRGDLETIARLKLELQSGVTKSINVPVDSHMTSLVISSVIIENNVSAEHTVKLFRPSGAQVLSSETGVSIATLSSGIIINVENPEVGTWRVDLQGYGPLTATVQGNSPITFDRFDFVEPNTDIHGGYAPISGQPLTGISDLVEASILGPLSTASFKMLDEAGNEIETLSLVRNAPSGDPDHFIGVTSTPSVPFRIAAIGTDDNGSAYRREYPTVYRAQSIAVNVSGSRVIEVEPGVSKDVGFTITNNGTPGTFIIQVEDERGYVTSAPPSIDLQTGQEAPVLVNVMAPEEAADDSSSGVVLTATRQGFPEVYNSAIATILVHSNESTDPRILQNGVVVTPLNGGVGEEIVYQIDVPNDLVALKIETYGGAGDLSLYAGIERVPTTTTNDGKSTKTGNGETINYSLPLSGRYYVMLRGEQAYSGASLVVRFTYSNEGGES